MVKLNIIKSKIDKFEFIPHNIIEMYQKFRCKYAFARYLLIQSNNYYLWQLLRFIDPYSLSINKNDALNTLIHIMTNLKILVNIFLKTNVLQKEELLEVNNYNIFLKYLYERNNERNKK
jgi:hypothetical protein